MKRCMRITEVWAVDTEEEAQEIINNAIESNGELTKKTVELKTKKSKGVIIDQAYKVTVQVDICGMFDDVEGVE